MFSFRLKTGKNAVLNQGDGVFADVKALGRSIGAVTPNGEPSEFDGDGDGFRTGPNGKDNIPVTPKQVASLWSDLKQKALEKDEKRLLDAVKKFQQRKPKFDIPRMAELIFGAKKREDAIAARKLTRQWAKSIFEVEGLGENGEYKSRIFDGVTGVSIYGRKRGILAAHQDEPYPHVRIAGEILDKDGNRVAIFSRYVYLNNDNDKEKPYVYHDYLRVIKDEDKGKGIGRDFTLATEMMYEKMGADEIHLNAGLADGTYTWLRAGYGFKSDKERVKLAKDIERRYQQMLRDAGSKENLVKGGFMSTVGRWHGDDGPPGTETKMPEPFLESMEELDKFLKMLGQLKTHPAGSDKELPPGMLTLFGKFSKQILRGVNIDVKKPVREFPGESKSITITGLDTFVPRMYN
jgi:hypothetical protein